MAEADSPWTSLEVAKLAVAALTPLLVLILTIVVAHANRRNDENRAANRRAVERLIELHTEMAPLINDLFCFFLRVGHFRTIDPPSAIARKRNLDRIYFVNEYLFGGEFREAYMRFMDGCFAHGVGAGLDAGLRTSLADLKRERGVVELWEGEWDRLFELEPADEFGRKAESDKHKKQQRLQYVSLMEAFAGQLGLHQ